jgi:hypothetical protein
VHGEIPCLVVRFGRRGLTGASAGLSGCAFSVNAFGIAAGSRFVLLVAQVLGAPASSTALDDAPAAQDERLVEEDESHVPPCCVSENSGAGITSRSSTRDDEQCELSEGGCVDERQSSKDWTHLVTC